MKHSNSSYEPSVFVCPDIGMAGSVWDFKMGRDVDTCDSTHMRAVKHCKKNKKFCIESWLEEKSCEHEENKPASVLHLDFLSDTSNWAILTLKSLFPGWFYPILFHVTIYTLGSTSWKNLRKRNKFGFLHFEMWVNWAFPVLVMLRWFLWGPGMKVSIKSSNTGVSGCTLYQTARINLSLFIS